MRSSEMNELNTCGVAPVRRPTLNFCDVEVIVAAVELVPLVTVPPKLYHLEAEPCFVMEYN